METLSAQSLAGALLKCYGSPHYEACFVFDSSTVYLNCVNELYRYYSEGSIPGNKDFVVRDVDTIIRFGNGSCIMLSCDVYPDAAAFRGKLEGMEIPYGYTTDYTQDGFCEAEELDEFLNGFKIIGGEK